MGRAIAVMVLAVFLALGLCAVVHAQSAPKLEFEAASVKPSALPAGNRAIRPGPQGGPGSVDPGRLTYTMNTIRELMVDAYGVKRSQIPGGPGWLDSEQFDIVAKVPGGATKEQVRVMLQNLLAERFKLTLHRETKEMSIYALVVGAKGPRLKESTVGEGGAQAAASAQPRAPGVRGMKLGSDGCPEVPPMMARNPTGSGTFMTMTPNGECMIARGETMEGLAAQLSNRFDRPVMDQTGLKGRYDFTLRYDPSSMPGGRGGPKDALEPPPAGDATNRSSSDGDVPPSIFDALQEQLGLRLEARKGPVELLVIDHVEKTPARN